jgi:hypothetical protein
MSKNDLPEVSAKSTKDQILAAYNDALTKLNAKERATPEVQKQQQEIQKVVAKVADVSKDNLVSDLAAVKLKAIKQIDVLSEDLFAEFQKLSDVRGAIKIEQKHLEELYQIKETANTFAALLKSYEEHSEKFKADMDRQKSTYEKAVADQRVHWKEENDKLEKEFKESKERLTLERKREEEEYKYKIDLKHRQENDAYEQTKAEREKQAIAQKEELDRREAEVAAREALMATLQAQVDAIPETIKKAVLEAEQTLKTKLDDTHAFEAKLKDAEHQSALKIADHTITALREQIKEQEKRLQAMAQKVDVASEQVQTIASKALDASVKRYLSPVSYDERNVA